ncbi:conserved hypothetical protein [Perkinsus marinus ATCC 50983]|uniref:Iron hydrogenase large subunit C-terminal domain-containing protein n=1 Tax=Perkinsus marinus (strain ATCC 50983 / TXsc) TaxID=423536 RepID=C5LW88_PERM5|nr:conserved hypothetical protein [Perkinsus marinus ATCC 50983]EEQ99025.1 conserved hypothetical protein [Perkinsus marinus ATCC 50983]|eukprot:XP_002766308.1 conserved hypothetical protein [Perkinsus marinus ATCC 50983]
MSGFSGVVKLADLDDFISPSTECVIPLAGALEKSKHEEATGEVRPQLIRSKKAEEKTTGQTATIAQVSLSDCLACSGCVTSAETILLTEQSTDALLQRLGAKSSDSSEEALPAEVVVSVTGPSRTSLSQYFNISPEKVAPALGEALRQLELKLQEKDDINLPRISCLNTSVSEAVALVLTREEAKRRKDDAERKGLPPKAFLTSHCPGWTCYAEKSLDADTVELLSNVRSAEQIQGLYVKSVIPHFRQIVAYRGFWDTYLSRIMLPKSSSSSLRRIYHVLVSPCFDRKLEVLRPNYRIKSASDSTDGVPSIDLVLGTSEIVSLLKNYDLHLSKFTNAEPTNDLLMCGSRCFVPFGDSSECGGYARGELQVAEDPKWISVKNQDLTHIGKVARAYGFRNVQNIVRKVNKRGFDYDFVEVMACPGGCGNGGAQVIPDTIAEEKDAEKSHMSSVVKLEYVEKAVNHENLIYHCMF